VTFSTLTMHRRAMIGSLAALAAGLGFGRRALALMPRPELRQDLIWPPCSDARPDYCVESLTVDGEDRLEELWAAYDPEAQGIGYHATGYFGSSSWGVVHLRFYHRSGEIDDVDASPEIAATVRTGEIRPVISTAFGNDYMQSMSGNAEDGWTLHVSGRPSLNRWESSNLDTMEFSFTGQSGLIDESGEVLYAGWASASGAREFTGPEFDGSGWVTTFAGSDIDQKGTFRAWLSESRLAMVGLTVDDAVINRSLTAHIGEKEVEVSLARLDDPANGPGMLLDISPFTIEGTPLNERSARGNTMLTIRRSAGVSAGAGRRRQRNGRRRRR